jgi:hypothetical protein
MQLSLEPTLAGSVFAALAVAGGAPWFSEGLRALRLRRQFARLAEAPLHEASAGLVHVRGRVGLDSPMFSPLSGHPCAGYRLEIQAVGAARSAIVDERRSFRLVADAFAARVRAQSACAAWDVAVTAQRDIGPNEVLGTHLNALIDRSPEARWARDAGQALRVTERALLAGTELHVIGHAHAARAFELPAELELARTGTDDQAALSGAGLPGALDLWIDDGGHLEFLVVSSEAPSARRLKVSPLRVVGVVAGPIVSLAGLLYLAHAIDRLQALGRF